MRRVLRRSIVRDPDGQPLAMRSERLTDDGRGWILATTVQTASHCSGCRRPVVDVAERRGVCDVCHRRECCVHCIAQCQLCMRRLCGRCRHGFAGHPAVTVCVTCGTQLLRRQALEDRRSIVDAELRRHFEQQRLLNQIESLRLNAERTRIMAQLQAMRLGLQSPAPSLLWRVLTFFGGQVRHHAQRLLR